ncbi:unnamed protein product, partial [Ectocarpus sp. 12 AP-2014]
AEVEASDETWLCPCCDEGPLAPLQAILSNAEQNPPLISRVLARLAKDTEAAALASQASPPHDSGGAGAGIRGAGDDLLDGDDLVGAVANLTVTLAAASAGASGVGAQGGGGGSGGGGGPDDAAAVSFS